MNSMLAGDALTGIEQGFQMFMMTMAIVAGLLAGSSRVEPEWIRRLVREGQTPAIHVRKLTFFRRP